MMRFKHVGIFVVMFLHVFATVGKCLVVFSVVFIAFALSFHVLFRAPNYAENETQLSLGNSLFNECFSTFNSLTQINQTDTSISSELQPFQYLGLSLFKTLMMMLGEYEHTATVIEPLTTGGTSLALHYPVITFIFYTTFVFLVPIILMNLLIGLAVGDIENVRRSAVQRLISQQVYWLADLEPKLTGIFRSKLYQPHWRKKSRINKTTVFMDKMNPPEMNDETLTQKYLQQTMQKIISIEKEIKLQTTRMAAMIEKLQIKTKEFSIDDGIYSGHILGWDSAMDVDYEV
ncbi:unnamed protein product [Heterobilharzia americana]|nr:unnamed protein product [Heterobilharzia americana]